MKFIIKFIYFVALTWSYFTLTTGAKLLSEDPQFLTICKRSDPAFGKCFAQNLETAFHEWKSGVPGLKSIRSLDPLNFKRVTIRQGNQAGPISINMELLNAALTGIGGTIIEDVGSNGKNMDIKLKITVPSFKLTGDYTLKGNILSLALNSQGKTLMTFEKAVLLLHMQMKLRERDGYEFAEVDKFHLDWIDNGDIHFQFDNLFNGDKSLEDGAHALLNANSRTIFDVLQPALTQTNQILVKDIVTKIFAYVPSKYLLE
ncbi:protein takeout-like [Musca vetustissima]|uniref:protein takeout-like n=1 Tax=Musca vetustissima TaxID=27455 RepID=UPI002AB6BDD6|nr:protein takeout-like [Musca vetustissima]